MRTAKDLIAEMETEAKKAEIGIGVLALCMVVKLGRRSEIVSDQDESPLTKLEDLIESGGKPIGLVAVRSIGRCLHFFVRPFAEYENKAWALDYLENFGARAMEKAKKFLFVTGKGHLFEPENN